MNFATTNLCPAVAKRSRRQCGFTLAEVLAALAFMAVVIPVAVQGIRVASLAGEVSLRKASAARIADRVLNEYIVTSKSQTPARNGTVLEGAVEYRWLISSVPWNQDTMRQVTVQVYYTAQGQEYDLQLTTLLDNSSS